MIAMICAKGMNGEIGKDNKLLWSIPEDLAYFKEMTLGKTVVMGRKTFDSIGKALPGRKNVVLTKDPYFNSTEVKVIRNIEEVFLIEGEVMIIGGETLYTQMLEYSEYVYLTEVEAEFEADTFFPELPENEWRLVSSERRENEEFAYNFNVYKRINAKFW